VREVQDAMPKKTLVEELESEGFVQGYARMWPRDVFDCVISPAGKKKRYLARQLEILQKPGVYILYRNETPYYIGKAGGWLWQRLHIHARKPGTRYGDFWNYFSVFVIENDAHRDFVEGLLIAAMPTANSARPRLERDPLPKEVRQMMRNRRDFMFDMTIESDEEEGA